MGDIKEVYEGVYCLTWPLEGWGISVSSTLVVISGHAIIVDTFSAPRYMEPFVGLLKDLEQRRHNVSRPDSPSGDFSASLREIKDISVIYTHSDWDHCLGTSALFDQFGGSHDITIISHQIARDYLRSRTLLDVEKVRESYPHVVEDARIRMPDITFSERMNLYIGELPQSQNESHIITLELSHIGGHTRDSIACYIPEYEILIAGDLVEEPIPSVGDPSGLGCWIHFLKVAANRVKLVIPSHGNPQGPGILARNAEYLESLVDRDWNDKVPDIGGIFDCGLGVCEQDTIRTYTAIHEANAEIVKGWKMSNS